MADTDHLNVNVEEQIAKRLFDAGLPDLARAAVARSQSLDDETPLSELAHGRYEPAGAEELKARADEAAADALGRLRGERDDLLRGSDWTQLPDAGVDAAAWAAYRQELRDMFVNVEDPSKVEWPVAP